MAEDGAAAPVHTQSQNGNKRPRDCIKEANRVGLTRRRRDRLRDARGGAEKAPENCLNAARRLNPAL